MALIKSVIGSAVGTLSEQYKEYFYCEAMGDEVLACKGIKRKSGKSGNYGSDNIISDGSVIAIADGQCMIICDQGQVIDVCAEPGEYVYDMSSQPSIFQGNLSDNVVKMFEEMVKRFTFGGEAAGDQRVYFINTKEIKGNKYGTPNAVPFRVVDKNAGFDFDIGIRCFGEYSYKISNPLLFYKNVCGNFSSVYKRDEIDSQLKTELLTALQYAFSEVGKTGVRYSELPAHTFEICDALNTALNSKWKEYRGIEVVSFGVSSVSANEDDEKRIKDLQISAVYKDPTLAAANLAAAQAQAMRDAANNPNGAMSGFMGLNMAQQSGGINVSELYNMGAANKGDKWFCPNCGAECNGNFCSKCGCKRPE